MKILLADDEQLALDSLAAAVGEAVPEAELFPFRRAKDLLDFASDNPCDIAFLDIEMRGMNGIELAKRLKERLPKINLIFVTGHTQYMGPAFRLHASGYLLKPVTSQDVINEIDNLRNPIPSGSDRLRVQAFGNFEVFCGNEIVHFRRAKAKELFAYLIDRKGATATMAEIAAVLWEGQAYGRSQLSQIHTFLAEIKNTLAKTGHNDVLVKKRNSVAVNVWAVDCDYYKFLEGDLPTINSFSGEYMTNYTWAEFTVGSLSALSRKR